jgi:periplasmic copper chaperone A
MAHGTGSTMRDLARSQVAFYSGALGVLKVLEGELAVYTRIHRLTFLLALAWAIPALAADQRMGSLTITQPWSRATAPGAAVGVAYFEIVNSGGQDTLLRVEAPIAQYVEMHSMTSIGGLMQMRQVLSVDVPAKGRVRFEPGGLHVMLIDLTQPLKEGQRFPLTLVFQHAGSMRVEAIVQGLGATAAPSQGEAAHEHHQ